MKRYVQVTWESYGYVEVEADSMEKAMEAFEKDPGKYIGNLAVTEFIDGSSQLGSHDVAEMELAETELMKRICKIKHRFHCQNQSIYCV